MSADILFLYGPSGAGKTRLLQMIADSCREPSIMRVGCEEFADELVGSIRDESYKDFVDRYTSVKTLLLDNLWILRSWPIVAKEMRQLIKARAAHGNLTVLASDLEYEDVFRTIPAIGDCLSEQLVIHLRLHKAPRHRFSRLDVRARTPRPLVDL